MGIHDLAVLKAIASVPRDRFVDPCLVSKAYVNKPQPIGYGQTISQPFMVAAMAEAARLHPEDRVLEVGTGSGYGAAVLAQLVKHVISIEIRAHLLDQARARFAAMKLTHIKTHLASGFEGWPAGAPYDAILVTAAPETIPSCLVDQLALGGRLIIPCGEVQGDQSLYRLTKRESGLREERLMAVRFVPMVHRAD